MLNKTQHLPQKLAVGAVMVALSGFIPKPSRVANAATATISASGSFTGGIQVTAKTNVNFGQIVATAPNGSISITPGGATFVNGAFFNSPTISNGAVVFNAGAAKTMTVAVAGLQNGLTLGTVGGQKTGVVNLGTVKVAGPFAGTMTLTTGMVSDTVALTSTTLPVRVGAILSWGGVQPIGTFAHSVVITLTF